MRWRRRTLTEASAILLISAVLAVAVNRLHPRGVAIFSISPETSALDDSLLFAAIADSTLELDSPPRISTEAVRKLLQNGLAVLVDARPPAQYAEGHIPGALSIPYEQFYERADQLREIPPSVWVICYCDGPPCDLAELLAAELWAAGLRRVAIYHGGLKAWKASGGSIESE